MFQGEIYDIKSYIGENISRNCVLSECNAAVTAIYTMQIKKECLGLPSIPIKTAGCSRYLCPDIMQSRTLKFLYSLVKQVSQNQVVEPEIGCSNYGAAVRRVIMIGEVECMWSTGSS
jgi:hypothetical protein